ncbi:MAG: hypothetical protein AB1730_18370 [Myxococcota bacterium]
MGFLGGIGKAIGNVIKPLAQTAIRAIAPAATSMLKGVVGDLFTAGKGALNTFLAMSPLPSPLKGLAQKLLGKGLDALQNLAQGGIEKAIAALVNMLAPRTTSDGVTVTPTPITQPSRTDSIVNNTPTASSSGAATGTAGAASGGSGAIAAAGGSIGSWSPSQGMPKASQFGDLSKPENLEQYKAAQFQYQQMMSNINEFWQLMSTVFKKQADTSAQIIGNMR